MSKPSFAFTAIALLVASVGAYAGEVQLITDGHFQTGFDVLDPISGAVQGPLQYTTQYGSPKWQLAQWDSKQTIYGTTPVEIGGAYHYTNAYKKLVMGPTTTAYADLQLGVNSLAEYGNQYRANGQPWPAFLAQQEISTPNGWVGGSAPSIADMTSLDYKIDVNLTLANNVYTSGYNSLFHAAQFVNYFTVQNLNPNSPGYGQDYLWFGILLYDDRYAATTSYQMMDLGTGKLIYALGVSDFGETSGPQVGEWLNVSGDILPHVKDALDYAWSNGIMTASTDYGDYKIGAMNIGWEVPGLSDVNMQLRNLSLTAVPEPSTFALLATGMMGILGWAWRRRRS